MTIAVQVRGLRKSYKAGAGSCLAAIEVLRGIELTLCAGESIGIVGAANSGKSTLLLCLAGLLTPDAGDIAWFDRHDRIVAERRACYHVTRTDLLRAPSGTEPRLHLVDVASGHDHYIAAWVESRRAHGDAVVVAACDIGAVEHLDRQCTLHSGFLRPPAGFTTRVAEARTR